MDRGVHPQGQGAPPFMHRAAQMLHRAVIGNIHRRERGDATHGLDFVIQFFERASCPGDGHDVRATGRKGDSNASPKTAGGAGDQREGRRSVVCHGGACGMPCDVVQGHARTALLDFCCMSLALPLRNM